MTDTLMLGRSRRFTLAALVIVLGLIVSACTDDDAVEGQSPSTTGASHEPGAVTRGGTMIVGLEAESNNWLPGSAVLSEAGANVAMAIYDSIAARGADGQVHPYLARSIEPNLDLTEWTVTLREGIVMHDGTELDAHVMKRIFDEYLKLPSATTAEILAPVDSVRVDDDLVYTYELNQTLSTLPDLLVGVVGYPFSIEACEARGGRDGDCPEHPVGAGPFRFVDWVRDGDLTLERNENYWRTGPNGDQLPYLDRIVFRPIPDEALRLSSVAADTIQVAQTLSLDTIRKARDSAGIVSNEAIENLADGAIFNTRVPPLDDLRVRRGLSHAVDQEGLIEVLGGEGITRPHTQFFSSDSPWYSSRVEADYPGHEPHRASALFDEYIHDRDRSDGRAVGDPISIEFDCPPEPRLRDLGRRYEMYWRDAGLQVQFNSVEQTQHIVNAVDADGDPPFSGRYMISCWRMGADEDPHVMLRAAFDDPETTATNLTNYTSDRLQANLATLRRSIDFHERYTAVEDIGLELAEKVPLVWAGGTVAAFLTTPAVQNVVGWTIPDEHGAPTIAGTGAAGASIRWSEVWLQP